MTLEWAPDGRLFMTATIAPRLRVDNGFHLYRCSQATLNFFNSGGCGAAASSDICSGTRKPMVSWCFTADDAAWPIRPSLSALRPGLWVQCTKQMCYALLFATLVHPVMMHVET